MKGTLHVQRLRPHSGRAQRKEQPGENVGEAEPLPDLPDGPRPGAPVDEPVERRPPKKIARKAAKH